MNRILRKSAVSLSILFALIILIPVVANGATLDGETVEESKVKNNDIATELVSLTGEEVPVGEGVMKDGFVDEDGHTYFYQNGKPLTGLQDFKEGKYYFHEDKEHLGMMAKDEFISIENKHYFFDESGKGKKKVFFSRAEKTYYSKGKGKLAIGLTRINDDNYFFENKPGDSFGVLVRNKRLFIDDDRYVFGPDGKGIPKGLLEFEGDLHFSLGRGLLAKGKVRDDKRKRYYFFDNKDMVAKDKGFFNDNGATYYSYGEGKLASGLTYIDGKLYYFRKNPNEESRSMLKNRGVFIKGERYLFGKDGVNVGRWQSRKGKAYLLKGDGQIAKNTKIGKVRIPKSGTLGKAYAYGINVLNRRGWKLKNAYRYAVETKYYGRYMRLKNSDAYAVYGFTKRKGNCYVSASQFYVMAKLLGYNARQMQGKVGIWPHSWVEIRHKGKVFVYDPEFQSATGRNGYRVRYGQKGTWRYSKYKKMV